MNIAYLLRGQPRLCDFGAYAFKRNYEKTEHDIRVFGHFWNRDSYTIDEHGEERELNHEQVENKIAQWKCHAYEITDYKSVFGLANNIDDINLNQPIRTDIYDYVHSTSKENEHNLAKAEAFLPNIRLYDTESKTIKYGNENFMLMEKCRRILRISRYIAQICSAKKSYDVYERYSAKYNWHADMIISTRTDVDILIAQNAFNRVVNNEKDKFTIFGNSNLQFDYKTGFNFCDLFFAMSAETSELVFSRLHTNIIKYLTTNKLVFVPTGLYNYMSETMWYHAMFLDQQNLKLNYLDSRTTMFRNNMSFDDIVKDNKVELIRLRELFQPIFGNNSHIRDRWMTQSILEMLVNNINHELYQRALKERQYDSVNNQL